MQFLHVLFPYLIHLYDLSFPHGDYSLIQHTFMSLLLSVKPGARCCDICGGKKKKHDPHLCLKPTGETKKSRDHGATV